MTRTKQQRGTVIALDSRRSTRALMHREKPVTCQLYAFPLQRGQYRRPGINRNAFALPPLLHRIPGTANIGGHRRERRPPLEHIINRAHAPQHAPDELSGQVPTMNPMTEIGPFRTIRPMGRGVTPTRVRSEIAIRLKAARIHAKFNTQKEAADALHIRVDRYEKWESGRTPVPAQNVGPVC